MSRGAPGGAQALPPPPLSAPLCASCAQTCQGRILVDQSLQPFAQERFFPCSTKAFAKGNFPCRAQPRGAGLLPRIFLCAPNPTMCCLPLPDLHVLKVLLSGNLVLSKPRGAPAPVHMQSFVLGDAQ